MNVHHDGKYPPVREKCIGNMWLFPINERERHRFENMFCRHGHLSAAAGRCFPIRRRYMQYIWFLYRTFPFCHVFRETGTLS